MSMHQQAAAEEAGSRIGSQQPMAAGALFALGTEDAVSRTGSML